MKSLETTKIFVDNANHIDPILFLQHFARIGNFEIVQYLVENRKCDIDLTSLFNSISPKPYFEIAKYFIEKKKELIDELGIGKTTCLHLATSVQSLELVKFFVDNGANLESRNIYNSTPIFHVCRNGNLEILKFLISRGAIVDNITETTGKTPALVAVTSDQIEILKYLVEHSKVEIDTISDLRGISLLRQAAENRNLPIVKYLIERNVDVNFETVSERWKNSLCLSLMRGDYEISKELIRAKNIDLNRVGTETGETPLFIVSKTLHLELVKELIQSGKPIDFNKPNNMKETPLFSIVKEYRQDPKIIDLFRAKCGIKLKTINFGIGVETYPFTADSSRFEIIKLLIENGAKLFPKND